MRLLNIVCSPRGEQSASISISQAFIQAYSQKFPGMEVDTLNVWEEHLPDFDSQAIGAKYKRVANEALNEAEHAAWTSIEKLVQRFRQADRIVLGIPMWNFSYPYKLKQLIDLVSQRNMLFSFDGRQYGPLLNISRALVIHVRGQSQGKDMMNPGFEHQSAYMDFWLKFIGVAEVLSIEVEHTWDRHAQETLEQAKAEAIALASAF
jgi:FMN-dependent NADH-azoreductase